MEQIDKILDLMKFSLNFLIVLVGIIQTFVYKHHKKNISIEQKNKYSQIIVENCPAPKKVIEKVGNYINKTNLVYSNFFIGIIVGIILGIIILCGLLIVFYFLDANNLNMLYIGTALNIFIIIILLAFLIWNKRFSSKDIIKPKFTENIELRWESRYILYFYWAMSGTIIGINIIPYIWLYVYSAVIISDLPGFWGACVYIYVLGIVISIVSYLNTALMSKQIHENIISAIQNFYTPEFPYISVKTDLCEIKGQLRDIIQNQTFITVSENGIIKVVPWDQIKMMEIGATVNSEVVFD